LNCRSAEKGHVSIGLSPSSCRTSIDSGVAHAMNCNNLASSPFPCLQDTTFLRKHEEIGRWEIVARCTGHQLGCSRFLLVYSRSHMGSCRKDYLSPAFSKSILIIP
jgi:hypothetical protein